MMSMHVEELRLVLSHAQLLLPVDYTNNRWPTHMLKRGEQQHSHDCVLWSRSPDCADSISST